MLVGGADQHRYDLSSMVMLKDNHVWSTGSITSAVRAARSVVGFSGKIEVEVSSEAEAEEAANAGADIVMLDNFGADGVKVAAVRLKAKWASEGKAHVLLECSGGLNESNVKDYICNGGCSSPCSLLGIEGHRQFRVDKCTYDRYRYYLDKLDSPGHKTC